MMRQAGRHMKVYRDLVAKYPTFRERSEIPEVSTEISLQPWEAYRPDGVILFSDILTPLPGMGVEFTIEEKTGPKIKPVRSWDQVREREPVACAWLSAVTMIHALGGARADAPLLTGCASENR